jgi:hypothetical protein
MVTLKACFSIRISFRVMVRSSIRVRTSIVMCMVRSRVCVRS